MHALIRSLDLEYNLYSFMRDLLAIRRQTLKESTITHAFAKAGIWPISSTIAVAKLRKYSKPALQAAPVLSIVILGNILREKGILYCHHMASAYIILSSYGLAVYCIMIIKLGNICSVNSVNHMTYK